MIDLKDLHIPSRVLLYNKNTNTYFMVLGYREPDDSYFCVPFQAPGQGGAPDGRIMPYTIAVDELNGLIEQRRCVMINAEYVADNPDLPPGSPKERRGIVYVTLSSIIYDHLKTLKLLHLAAANQWFGGEFHDCFVVWVDVTEEIAVVNFEIPGTWRTLWKPTYDTVVMPLRDVLEKMWPARTHLTAQLFK